MAGFMREIVSESSPLLLRAARWLIRNGTDRHAVLVGLGLLLGNAERRDVAMLRIIGRLRCAVHLAIDVLAAIPGAEQDLIWLVERARGYDRSRAVAALAESLDPAVRDWVRSTPRDLLSSDLARRIAEQHGLAELLHQPVVTDILWEQTGNLLLAMTNTHDCQSEIGRYEAAPAVYERWVALADSRPVTLERAALLAMVAEDLRTGPAAPVTAGRRGRLVDQIERVLSTCSRLGSDDPVTVRRVEWLMRQRDDAPRGRFAIRVVVPDPKPVGFPLVEARIVIDGVPVVAALFDKGPARSPEDLIHNGHLRATSEPREVMLAEAYCTEECCGGLYVTIVREGAEVVWRYRDGEEVRFDAAEYDREVARAEQDHSWEWPAMTLARLVTEELRTDPTILGRWDCALDWCTAWLKDGDTTRLVFGHPAHTASPDDPWMQFGLVIDVQGRDPATLAREIIESTRHTDPKTVAEMIGGNQEEAEKLGLRYRKPTRW